MEVKVEVEVEVEEVHNSRYIRSSAQQFGIRDGARAREAKLS
jgi:hypothetical protein